MSRKSISALVDDELEPLLSLGDYSVHLPVRLDVLSDHELYVDDTGHLSGIFIATRYPSRVGTPLTLDVRLSWNESLLLEGTVEWVRDVSRATLRIRKGMGLKFVDLLPQQQTLLNRALILREPMSVPADVTR